MEDLKLKTTSNKILYPSFSQRVEFCCKNLFRLMDQELDWFCQRIEAIKAGDMKRADYIEETYLIPLSFKIRQLAERMSRL